MVVIGQPIANAFINHSYADNDGDKRLRDCEQAVRDLDRQVHSRETALADLTDEIAKLSEQISQSTIEYTNLSENIRYREAQRAIKELDAEIETYDLEEAHRAKRQFETRYDAAEKARLSVHEKAS
jgi:DNA repair protein RAD50